jgi:hypothetical protein
MNTDKSFVFNLCLSAFIGGRHFFGVLPGDAKLGSSENTMRITCFQSLARAPLIGPDKGDAAAFSWAGMNGPAHGRFRFVGEGFWRPGKVICFHRVGFRARAGIGFVLLWSVCGGRGGIGFFRKYDAHDLFSITCVGSSDRPGQRRRCGIFMGGG